MKTSRLRLTIVGATVAVLAVCGTAVVGAPAHASVCNALGFTAEDLGSAGSSSGSSSLGSLDFGSAYAPGKKPQGPLPTFSGASRAVEWVTGPLSPNHTDKRFSITATDVGIPWDNGSGQVLMAFGDTWGPCGGQMGWRNNTMLRASGSSNLDKGVDIPAAVPGDVRSGASVTPQHPTFAQPIVNAIGINNIEVGRIPTGAIAINGVQYLSYMSIGGWGAPGRWVTNYSAIAVSHDNGQTWTTDNNTIRSNYELGIPGVPQVARGQGRFQLSAFLRSGDYVYQYGTPNGRFGAAFVTRVHPADILNLDRYEYFAGGNRWSSASVDAVPIVRQPVAEMSVTYNDYLGKFLMLTEQGGDVVLRTSPTPVGPWSGPRLVLSTKESSGLYAPFIYPRSTGQKLYFVVSRWDDYNVMLVRTDLAAFR